jgi:hypothetical protein
MLTDDGLVFDAGQTARVNSMMVSNWERCRFRSWQRRHGSALPLRRSSVLYSRRMQRRSAGVVISSA